MSGAKPANFSWFIEGKLAAMGHPDEDGNLRFLAAQGIKTLINLDEIQYYTESPAAHGLIVYSIPVEQGYQPTVKQIKVFLGIMDNTKNVSLHQVAK